MTILRSFGCSFVWGSDLSDANKFYPSNSTWPALLAKHLELNYRCYARPGCGNLQIAENILKSSTSNDIIIAQWTYIDRFDFTDSSSKNWYTIRPGNSSELNDFYYRTAIFVTNFLKKTFQVARKWLKAIIF